MRLLIAALLSVALILAAPAKTEHSDLNIDHAGLTQGSPEKLLQEGLQPTEEKAPEPEVIKSDSTTAGKTVVQENTVTPTCASEVKKYSWPQSVALQIVGAESSHNPNELNDNPGTGDYSVGCFQVNLRGSANLRAKYRDAVKAGYTGGMTVSGLEQWLKDPANNVAVAHIMWQSQSWSPWGYTTCKYKVKCY